MKKLLTLFIGVLLLTSCSDDDNTSVNASIVGEWSLKKLNTEMDLGVIRSVGEGKDYNASMTFSEQPNQVFSQGTVGLDQNLYIDGNLLSTEESVINFSNQFETGEWELSGNILTLSGQSSSVSINVITLTSNSLIFRYSPDETTIITYEFSR